MDDHDAIIIGTGQSGPSLARRLVAAGQKVAVIRTQVLRRHLRQYRMYADQNSRRECQLT
jgi:predicted dinucleotide-binding enzyme